MNKMDLKNRMVIELRNGKRFIVIDGIAIGVNYFIDLKDYYNDLSLNRTRFEYLINGFDNLDIMRVYDTVDATCYLDYDKDELKLLWDRDRDEPIEVTMDEVEKMFGRPVKIVE